jgi:hypothetical protein
VKTGTGAKNAAVEKPATEITFFADCSPLPLRHTFHIINKATKTPSAGLRLHHHHRRQHHHCQHQTDQIKPYTPNS